MALESVEKTQNNNSTIFQIRSSVGKNSPNQTSKKTRWKNINNNPKSLVKVKKALKLLSVKTKPESIGHVFVLIK